MAAITNKVLLIIACVIALIGWVVSLGGVGALNDHCNDATNSHDACSRMLRYSWWGVWYGFFLVIVILIMAVLGKTDAWTSTLQAFCAALLSVSMIDASEWHGVSGNAGAGNNDAVDAALAGFIIMSIGVALLIIFLGMGGAGVSVNLTVSRGSNKTSPAQEPAKEKAQEKEQAKAGKSPV